jgi:RimJ/RimL family protein N-acetyltransferase
MRDELDTARLRLRRWRPDDLEALARWHVDPDLMRHMGKLTFTREEVESDLERYERHWQEHGFGLWAAEEKESGALIGRVGLAYHRVWPADPEVGWLIDTPWQGRGLATEAGEACVRYGFDELGFERIVSICTADNAASRRVMEKLGLRLWHEIHDPKLGLDLLLHARERD